MARLIVAVRRSGVVLDCRAGWGPPGTALALESKSAQQPMNPKMVVTNGESLGCVGGHGQFVRPALVTNIRF
jgi:hypothetical protein